MEALDLNTDFSSLTDEELRRYMAQLTDLQAEDAKQAQLLYYKPAHDDAIKVHRSQAKIIGVGGGNRSAKTDTQLAELCALATGVFPDSHAGRLMREKFRGPINMRIIIESMKTHLHPVILPKFRWFAWQGRKPQGGNQGHWGWIPKFCLKDGDWDKSWSEKLTTLRVRCLDPDDFEYELGESVIQFMSFDQDPEQFASGTFDEILHDEPPPKPIWDESKARVLDNDGRLRLSMTWPDDPGVTVDWIFDEIYDIGQEGPNKDPDIDWFIFDTRHNVHLDQGSVSRRIDKMTEQERTIRIEGGNLRFSNLVHPLFTDMTKTWCFFCGKPSITDGKNCSACGSEDIADYNHVQDFETAAFWPAVFLLDPHPRKPHMFSWAQVDPSDDMWIVAEGQIDGDATEVRTMVEDIEDQLNIHTVMRLMDPNMGRSPVGGKREMVWQDEFEKAGLICDLADDSGVGRKRLNHFLAPEPGRMQPRFHIHPRCKTSVFQMKRYVWDEFRRVSDRDIKQTPKDKNDDYPTMFKYLMNFEPTFNFLKGGGQIIRRPGTRKGAY